MTSVGFFCHPRELANALNNAVIIGNGTGTSLKDNKDSCPHVYLAYQDSGDGENGIVAVYGAGRWTMGRTVIHLEGQCPEEPWLASLSAKNAKSLQSTLRASPCGADATAHVTIYSEPTEVAIGEPEDEDFDVVWADVSIAKNGESLADLAASDPEGGWWWVMDAVDDRLEGMQGEVEGPLAFPVDGVNRLTSLYSGSKVIDFARTDRAGVLAFKAGPDTMGIIGEVDRKVFASQGAGTEADLVATKSA